MDRTKEIFSILLENEEYFVQGLCPMIISLKDKYKWTWDDCKDAIIYIQKYAPDLSLMPLYKWPPGKWEPRKRWLYLETIKIQFYGKK